jgi:cation diffusion facilitator family transporter
MSGAEGKTEDTEATSSRLAEGRRVAAAATGLTVALAVIKGIVGELRGAPALTADAVHSGADAVAIFASWLGLRLADRPPTRRFPFGLYRAETLATLLVSAIIFFAGAALLFESASDFLRGDEPSGRSLDALVVALVSAAVSFGIYVWEKRVGERLRSQSLLANADESRADILTSLVVFGGTFATWLRLPRVELAVAAAISLLILWLGLKNGRVAVYALLDASLDTELEQQGRAIAEGIPGVKLVGQLRLRRAGPFCFGIARVQVQKTTDVSRAHEVAHRVVEAVRKQLPQVEMLTVHVEPFTAAEQTLMVPAEGRDLAARVSEHFGRAKWFLFAHTSGESVERVECVENPFRERKARAALSVIKSSLAGRALDAVLTREMGEIAFHTLRDHYVAIYSVPACSVREALAKFAAGELAALPGPTHASEAAGAPTDSPGTDAENRQQE